MNRFLIGFLSVFSFININSVFGQTKGVSLERAIELALLNNLEYNACKLKVEQSKALIPTALTIETFMGSNRVLVFRLFILLNIKLPAPRASWLIENWKLLKGN